LTIWKTIEFDGKVNEKTSTQQLRPLKRKKSERLDHKKGKKSKKETDGRVLCPA